MGRVDPQDDRVARYIVFHHRYDPDRHERRNMIEAAYDNHDEMVAHVLQLTRSLRTLQAQDSVDSREHCHGGILPPGYNERIRTERIESRRARRRTDQAGLT